MTKRWGVLLLVVIVVATVAFLVLKKRPHEGPSAHAQHAGSAQTAAVAPSALENKDPARALVSVTDANGPVASATVRLSREGEVTLVQTGTDGVASAGDLDPGEWSISASADGHEPAAATTRELRAGETAKIDIKLAAGGRTLTGLVTDASGGPIAGARIDATKLGGLARPSDAVASTQTGADGRYKLQVAEGQLLVAASEASYAPQSRHVDVGAAGATADFQLVPGGVIEGIVRDAKTREPVAGARVFAQRDSGAMLLGERKEHRVVTNANGRFRVAGLRPGAYNVDAKAPGRVSHAPTLVGLGVAEQVTDVEILVGASPVIRGIVIDEQGQPAPGVEVLAFSRGGIGEEATSDARGAFELEGLAPGSYMLRGRSDMYLPAGTTKVELDTKDLDGVKVNVTRGLRLKGHVERRQVCEVTLDMPNRALSDEFQLFSPTTTGANGEFDLGPTKPGEYELTAHCPSGEQGSKSVKAPVAAEIVIEVKPGASIAGKVIDGKGQPVAGVGVTADQLGDNERTMIVNGMMVSGVQTLTNGKGEFELRGLAAGSYRLRALDRGRPLPMTTESKVTVAAAEKKTGVTLTVERADGVIRGVVTGPDGKPLADAWVSVHQNLEDLLSGMGVERGGGSPGSHMIAAQKDDSGDSADYAPALTDAAGKFELTNLARVPWTVTAEAQAGKLRGRATKVVPDATITIQAVDLTELRGTVRAPSGVPSSFVVELEGPTRAQRTFTTPDGTFSFGRVDPGDYTVTVTSTAGSGKATVKVLAGQPATVTIDLVSNAIVIGKLVDATGKPLGGLPVAVVPDTGDGGMRIEMNGPPPTSNADGTFRVDAKAGPSIVVVVVLPRPVTKRGIVLAPGKTFDAGTITVETGAKPQP